MLQGPVAQKSWLALIQGEILVPVLQSGNWAVNLELTSFILGQSEKHFNFYKNRSLFLREATANVISAVSTQG